MKEFPSYLRLGIFLFMGSFLGAFFVRGWIDAMPQATKGQTTAGAQQEAPDARRAPAAIVILPQSNRNIMAIREFAVGSNTVRVSDIPARHALPH